MTSFAKTQAPTPIAAHSPRQSFEAAREGSSSAPGRGSQMVQQDKPAPKPRPSPDLAFGPDGTAFSAKWDKETQDARDARKAAFIRERTDPETGGHIRTLNKTFNR